MEKVGADIVKNALTLNEALYISTQYKELKGNRIMTSSGEAEVVCVAVSPADDINKWIFLQRFIDTSDPEKALDFYKVPYYDVVLIVAYNQGGPLSCISLRPPDVPVIL